MSDILEAIRQQAAEGAVQALTEAVGRLSTDDYDKRSGGLVRTAAGEVQRNRDIHMVLVSVCIPLGIEAPPPPASPKRKPRTPKAK